MSVVNIARKYKGSPYLFGGNGTDPGQKMDCSRFVQNVMREMGVSISRSTHTQKNEGQPVNFNDMQPGDCIYYDGHVVMFIGNGTIIHASSSKGQVVEQGIYDTKNIITIRRFLRNAGGGSNITNKLDVSSIADLDLYNSLHVDLQKAFRGNKNSLSNHLYQYGLREGRIYSYVFDPRFYSNKYVDIKNAFGDDFGAVSNHYLQYGINEGRQGSIIFDVSFYKNTYQDLQNAFGGDNKQYVNHFIQYGIHEGRKASNEFDPSFYKNNYADLRKAFGNNMKSYYQHYIQFGRNEGRKAHN